MERDKMLNLHKNATKARALELDLIDLQKEEARLQEKVEELKSASKPKKRFLGFGKKDQDTYEMNQRKVHYDTAMSELSYTQDLIHSKSNELSSLQDTMEEFSKLYEEKLALVKLSGTHKKELQLLETTYLINLKRKELLPEIKENAWRIQYQIQNIILILKQALEAYNADVSGSLSPYNKFERIDKAKAETEKLEVMLRKFQTTLNEIDLKLNIQVNAKNFVSYAQEGNESFWTDSRVLTLQVREQVKETLKKFEEMKIQVENFKKELVTMENKMLMALYESQNQLEKFVILSI